MKDPVDLTGLQCPLPVLRTQKLLRSMNPGEHIVVHVSDPASTIDMPHFCAESGNKLISSEQRQALFIFEIEKA